MCRCQQLLGYVDMYIIVDANYVNVFMCSQEGPLYKLRAKLVFSPVHASVRHLAQAVDAFVRQGESVLHSSTQGCNTNYNNRLLAKVCDSPNEAALALQALPLLHLAGFSTLFLFI
jgi:hypothetical protein